jgi:type 1 glutamine amidotransferase
LRSRCTLCGLVALSLVGCAAGDGKPGPSAGADGAVMQDGPAPATDSGSPGNLDGGDRDGMPSTPADTGTAPADGASTPVDGPSSTPADSGAPAGKVLIFSRTTGFRHTSIEPAVARLSGALVERGFTAEATEDPAVFTGAGGLARFAAVVLLSTTGKPLGDPGTAALSALQSFVQGGGALVGLHSATSTEYAPAEPLTRLLGGRFVDHPGGVRTASCHREGNHPASSVLPEPFVVKDEIYFMDNLRADNQVVLSCDAESGPARLPIAWYRQEGGAGRVFYTALGHANEDWQPTAPKFRDHILPGVLWALGR